MKPAKRTALLLILTLLTLSGCNDPELQSEWTSSFSLDGNEDSWPQNPTYFEENYKLRVSLMNDAEHLYIRLVTRNQTTKMLFMRAGFTVWLDSTGGNGKEFGVQFPLAREKQSLSRIPDHKARNGMEEMLEDSRYNLAVLNDQDETRQTMTTGTAEEMSIYTYLDIQQGYLIYELKLPLPSDMKTGTLGVGFESGKLEMGAGRKSSGGGRGGRGGGGGGRGGGKGMKGQGKGHGGTPQKPVELWAKVHLATDQISEK